MYMCVNRDAADGVMAVGTKQTHTYIKVTPTDLNFIRVFAEKKPRTEAAKSFKSLWHLDPDKR